MRAAIYTRISSDRTGAGLGVDRQDADCNDLADRLGWEVVETFSDNDISAYSGKRRPGYDDLLSAIADGRVEAVIAWHPDRLHRRAAELEEFVAICEQHSTAVQTVRAGSVDLATASGRMVARMLGAAAQHEVDHARERMQRAKAQAAADGKWRGGPRPFGYEPDGVTVRPSEASALLEAARSVVAGRSLSAISREMNEAGHRGSRGQEWAGTRLRHTLMRPRNAGLMEVGGEIVGNGCWPAIIHEDLWRMTVAVLNDPSRKTTTGPERRWLGSGIFRCGECSGPLRASKSNGKVVYRCENGHVSRQASVVDSYVEGVVRELLRRDSAKLQAQARSTAPVEALDALEALRSRLAVFESDYAAGDITGRQLREASERIQAEIDKADRRLAQQASRDALASVWGSDDPGAAYDASTLDRKRAIVADLLTVAVHPGTRGRPKGWKPGQPYSDVESIDIKPGRAYADN